MQGPAPGGCVERRAIEVIVEQGRNTGSRILVVDDEDTVRTVITQVLDDDGYQVTDAPNAEEALRLFRQDSYPLVITDIVMGKMSGLELLQEVKLLDPDALVVVMTSHASVDTATNALRAGAYDYLIKPFDDIDQISTVAHRALEKVKLVRENRQLMNRLKENAEELKVLNQSLKDLAIRDGLTGLYNHRYFREALEAEIARSKRHSHSFSLIFIDVDHFKQYNDTHGHLAGDIVLKTIAKLLHQRCRASTTVARYGGEEFVLLVPETSKEGAQTFAETIREIVEKHAFEGRETQPGGQVTLSLGVASYPGDATTSEELLHCADQALYRAKQSGRNKVCI